MTTAAPGPGNQAALEKLVTRGDVARALGITPKRLNYLLYRLSARHRYREFEIQKRSGGMRLLRAPILPLKKAQKIVSELLGALYVPRSCVYGYVDGRSIQMNADHRGLRRTPLSRFRVPTAASTFRERKPNTERSSSGLVSPSALVGTSQDPQASPHVLRDPSASGTVDA